VTHELDPDDLSRAYSGDGHQKTRASTSRGAIAAATCAKRSAPLAPTTTQPGSANTPASVSAIPSIKIFNYIKIDGSGSSP